MTSYPLRLKFRPECLHDLEVLRDGLPDLDIRVPPEPEGPEEKLFHAMGSAEIEVTVASQPELKSLIIAMATQEDGHRMWQTIDLAEHFTGDAFHGETTGRYARLEAALGIERGFEEHIFAQPEADETPSPR